jgi:hypothetical protein
VVLARSGKGDRLQPGAEAEPYVQNLQPLFHGLSHGPTCAIDSLWAEMDGVAP